MSSNEQQDGAATAPAPAADGAPRATRPRDIPVTHLIPEPTQIALIDAALGQLDATRTALQAALGRDVNSLACPNLHGAHGLLEEARRCLANARRMAR